MRRLLFVLFGLLISSDLALAAPAAVSEGKAGFEACTNAIGCFKGEGAVLTGKAEIDGGKVKGTFDVDFAGVKTGMDLRDTHTKETLGGKASLALDPTPASAGKHEVKGQLTIKGVTKPAKGSCNATPSGAGWDVACELDVKISDYPSLYKPGETKLSNLGVSVKDDVKVSASFKLQP